MTFLFTLAVNHLKGTAKNYAGRHYQRSEAIPFLSNTVIASAAKQSRLLKKLKDSISSSLKTGLLRHFVPRKDGVLLDCFRYLRLDCFVV